MGEEKVKYPVEDVPYNEDGVDVSHIQSFMDKTPAERLHYAQSFVENVLKVRALNAAR